MNLYLSEFYTGFILIFGIENYRHVNIKKIPFDLSTIAEVFKLECNSDCLELKNWLSHEYELSTAELDLLSKVHQEMATSSDYLNEEEIKIRLIAPLLQIADLDQGDQIRVFLNAA